MLITWVPLGRILRGFAPLQAFTPQAPFGKRVLDPPNHHRSPRRQRGKEKFVSLPLLFKLI